MKSGDQCASRWVSEVPCVDSALLNYGYIMVADFFFFFCFQELYSAAHNVARELLNTERTYALLLCF